MRAHDLRALHRRLLCQHPAEAELVAHLAQTLPPMQGARVAGHLAICTLCARAHGQLQLQIADQLLPRRALWKEMAPALKRLVEPIALVCRGLGGLRSASGLPPLPCPSGAATMDASSHTVLEWRLQDDGVELQLSAAAAAPQAALLELRVRVVAAGQGEPPSGRLEILDERGQSYLSGPLSKFTHLAARVPAGKWLVRVCARLDSRTLAWEIPVHAQESDE
jgi:hypothetical protein